MYNAKTLSISIKRPSFVVYEFVRNPENLPRWSTGVGSNLRREDSRWLIDMPEGTVEIRFVEKNDFGILDHSVIANDGTVFLNPMRVVSNEKDSEVIFTVFQFQGVSEEQHLSDTQTVMRDLRSLKTVLEAQE